ncbi:MAG: hypothetical protein M3R45_08630 [Pseudomonadota bacterium]|nr:hypothetical protein [Pseudomonadota bacterium]
MNISPFFLNLRSAYRAEMDDLTFDSDGRDVLRQRLAEKRKEISFLLQMMELSPEMVAVIFHQGLSFKHPAVMDHLLSHEADELPEWSTLADGVALAPWAREPAQTILSAPGGEWFMTVAAGLHYMAGKPDAAFSALDGLDAAEDGDEDGDENGDEDETSVQDDFDDHESDEVRGNARTRNEAGADWLAGQGFDRKD